MSDSSSITVTATARLHCHRRWHRHPCILPDPDAHGRPALINTAAPATAAWPRCTLLLLRCHSPVFGFVIYGYMPASAAAGDAVDDDSEQDQEENTA